jgi:toxin YoeB
MINFTTTAIEQLSYWIQEDNKLPLRIFRLLQELEQSPFTGTGKPEPLKGDFKGYWSRRINEEHRLIYKIIPGQVIVHSCRFHYTK